MIAFAPAIGSALQQVSDAGGPQQPLTRLEKGDRSHLWPEFLPGGKAVLFVAEGRASNDAFGPVAVQSVGTGEGRTLIQGGMQPRYGPSGHLLYAQGGNLMAVPFDPQRLTVTGAPVPVIESVMQSQPTHTAHYSVPRRDRWSMFRGVLRRPNARWYGSIERVWSWRCLRLLTPMGFRGSHPMDSASP